MKIGMERAEKKYSKRSDAEKGEKIETDPLLAFRLMCKNLQFSLLQFY